MHRPGGTPSRLAAWPLLLGLAALAAATAIWSEGRWWTLPDRHNPWAVLNINDEPNWLTRYKLRRLDERPFACQAVLATAAMQADPVPDRAVEAGCGWTNAVRVRRTQWQADPPFVLSCRAAVSLALWERHVVAPAAERLLGARPLRVDHFGSYACRNVNNANSGSRSRHAQADALDIAGFVFPRGQRVTVARDWGRAAAMPAAGTQRPTAAVNASDGTAEETARVTGQATVQETGQQTGRQTGQQTGPTPQATSDPKAAFLRAIHRGACDYFDVVLGPDYNRAHADHLHLDRGSSRTCR